MRTDGMTRDEEIRTRNADACPVVRSLERVGTPWRLNVLYELRGGERRFNDLKRATGARSKTLSDALEALTDHGLVDRRMEEAAPVAVYYSLTEKGEALSPVLDTFETWAREWVDDVPEEADPRGGLPRHR